MIHKGISPVISTLIILVVAIVVSLLYATISQSTTATITPEVPKGLQALMDALSTHGVTTGKSVIVVRIGSFVDPNQVAEISSILAEAGFKVTEVELSQLDVESIVSKQLVILVGPLDPSKFPDVTYSTKLENLFSTAARSGVPILYLYSMDNPAITHVPSYDSKVGFIAINLYSTMKQPNAFVLRYPISYVSTNPAETDNIEEIYTEVGAANKQVNTLLLPSSKLIVAMYPAEMPRLLRPIELKISSEDVGTIDVTDPNSAILYAKFSYKGYDIIAVSTTDTNKVAITDRDAMHPSVYRKNERIRNPQSLFRNWKVYFDNTQITLESPTGEKIVKLWMRIPAIAVLPPGSTGVVYGSSTMYINDYKYFTFVIRDSRGNRYLVIDRNSDGYFDVEATEELNERIVERGEFYVKYFEYLQLKVSEIDFAGREVTIDLVGIGGRYGTANLAAVVETTLGRSRVIAAPLFFSRQNENTMRLLGVLIGRLLS